MRIFATLTCLVGVCLACCLLFVDSTVAQDGFTNPAFMSRAESGGSGGSGATKKAAGAFLGTATGLGEPIHFLVTLERDGIFNASDSSDFGFGGLGGLDSDQYGTWRKTGNRQITSVGLVLSHDLGTGELMTVLRLTGVVDFNPAFTEGTGTITVEAFAPFQVLDPLNPNTEEEPLGGVVVLDQTMKRLGSVDDDDEDGDDDGDDF